MGHFPTLVRSIANENNLKAPDPKTLRKGQKEGVTPSTAEKILGIFRSALTDCLHSSIEAGIENHAKGNGVSWVYGLSGLKYSVIGHSIAGSHFESFIQRRMAQETNALLWVRDRTGLLNGGHRKPEVFVQYAQCFLRRNTGVNPELISLLSTIDVHATDKNSPAWRWGKSLAKLINHQLRVDFYYSLLCEVTLDIAEYLFENGVYEQYKSQIIEHGLVGDVAPSASAAEYLGDTPFIKLLEVWTKQRSPSANRPLGWRGLSRYLPSPRGLDAASRNSDEMETSDNKYSRIKEWRAGVVPKSEQWQQLVESLFGDQDADHHLAWVKCNVALAWGRFMHDELNVLKEVIAEYPELSCFDALGEYQRYWTQYRNHASAISEA